MSITIHSGPTLQLDVTVAPALEPVTWDELKREARLIDEDDAQLGVALIAQARQVVEDETRRAIMQQTRALHLPAFPAGTGAVIELPGGHVQSVASVTYLDADGASQTWAADNYRLHLATERGTGALSLARDADWPTVMGRGLCVTITYVAGWAQRDQVPTALRSLVLRVARLLHDHEQVDDFTRRLLSHWRIHRLA